MISGNCNSDLFDVLKLNLMNLVKISLRIEKINFFKKNRIDISIYIYELFFPDNYNLSCNEIKISNIFKDFIQSNIFLY